MSEKQPKPAAPAFSHRELVIINNALNEVCNGLSLADDEFQTRIGYARDEARRVLTKVSKLLKT